MSRKWRVVAAALAVAVANLIRTDVPADSSTHIHFERLPVAVGEAGPFKVEEAWRLTSRSKVFGGYSALLLADSGKFVALNDRGRTLRFGRPSAGEHEAEFGWLLRFGDPFLDTRDFEAMTADPASGTVWAAFEGNHGVARLPRSGPVEIVHPKEMAGWRSNSGAEAIARLEDGRFIVLAERNLGWLEETSPALLYPADPVTGAIPLGFNLRLEDGYRPTDLAPLPDGRVLMLARRVALGVPPRFPARLLLGDPAEIEAGQTWRPKVLATIADPLPSDNFEGLAVEPAAGGRLTVWLISDDNLSLLQHTLLLKLSIDPAQLPKLKARGKPRASSL